MTKGRIVLINPKFTEEVSIFSIPVSLIYLGTWLEDKGYTVVILDRLHLKEQEFWSRLGYEIDQHPLYIGLTVMSTQIPDAIKISKIVRIKQRRLLNKDKAPVVWGGIHPTLYPEQTAQEDYLDLVVVGEGENFIESIKPGSKIVRPESLKDISKYPKINWNLVQQLEPTMTLKEISERCEFGISLLTSRGCPHKCTFCINSILHTTYRRRPANLVIEDIKDAVKQGITKIQFEDEDFFADRKRVEAVVDQLISENIKIQWAAGCRTSYFDKKTDYMANTNFLLKLKQSGCYFLGTGAESGSQRILDMVSKHSRVENTLDMATALKGTGIKSNYSFMVGLPGESVGEYKLTNNIIDKLIHIDYNIYILGPQIYRPYPGSELYNLCIKAGMKEPQSLSEWASSPYIHFEFSRGREYFKNFYPWIQYKRDLTNLVFYSTLMGMRPRNPLMTKILRTIGRLRCKLFWFDFPVEKWLYGIIRGSIVEKVLR